MPEVPDSEAIKRIQKAMPAQGMFDQKSWRTSARPFPLAPETVEELRRLGPVLNRFQRACNLIYRRSVLGSLPNWVYDYLDRGKPKALVEFGRARSLYDTVPGVIRPDLVLKKGGFAITEIDTVPGGIGLTGWLNQTYGELGYDVIGGATGMTEGFAKMFPKGADLVISEEAGDYRPEMEWLTNQLDPETWQLHQAETYQPRDVPIYRFFELFDLGNVPFAQRIIETRANAVAINPPMKAFLEEKLWLALFWMQPLQEVWRRELRTSNWAWLKKKIPYSWVVDPTPIPHHAVLPKLGIRDFQELAGFSQKQRNLVLKISGFSERAWGSRGVHMAMDLPHDEWADALREATDSFPHHPYVLQEFHKGRKVEHPYYDEETGQTVTMTGRVRLCPYYFVPGDDNGRSIGRPQLGGVMATICPEDKKVLHGMTDAIIVPCVEADNGY